MPTGQRFPFLFRPLKNNNHWSHVFPAKIQNGVFLKVAKNGLRKGNNDRSGVTD
jgi:hypothetical protein